MIADPLPNAPPEYRERGPDGLISIRVRFTIWIVVVLGLLTAVPTWCFLTRRHQGDVNLWGGATVVTVLLAAMAWLIISTPPNAIRFSPWRSIGFITLTTTWLSIVAFTQTGVHAATPWQMPNVPDRLILSAALLAIAHQYAGQTPWWSAVLTWNPMALGPIAAPSEVVAIILIGLAVAIVVSVWLRPAV